MLLPKCVCLRGSAPDPAEGFQRPSWQPLGLTIAEGPTELRAPGPRDPTIRHCKYGILAWGDNNNRVYKLQKRAVRIISFSKFRKILQMEVDGKRNRVRPKLRWRDLVKDNMARNQMTTEMAEDRSHWHVMIRAGTLRSVEADR